MVHSTAADFPHGRPQQYLQWKPLCQLLVLEDGNSHPQAEAFGTRWNHLRGFKALPLDLAGTS